jgi:hypothetical protein
VGRRLGLASEQFRAHIQEMTSDASSSAEIVNGRRILGRPWGWQLEFQRIRMAKFPDKPLTSWQKFDTLELAREAANRLGPIQEIDESEYDPKKP